MRRIDVVKVQLVKEGVLPYHTRQVCNPKDAAGLVAEHVAGADREVFVLVMLDHVVIGDDGRFVSFRDRGITF